MVDYNLDPELGIRIHEIVGKFHENFLHIDPREILPIRTSNNGKLQAWAEVRLIPRWVRPVTEDYKVAMLVHEELFYDQATEEAQTLIIIHELTHIVPDDDHYGEYLMRKHEVQDFAEMVHLLGQNWAERVDGQLNVMASDSNDWREAVSSKTGRSIDEVEFKAERPAIPPRKRKSAKRTRKDEE